MICAHFDSTANRTSGWRPAIDPAPGADDNATGTAALLEYARAQPGVERARVAPQPLDDAGPYVAAAYLVFLALILIYVAIMATKLGRIEREISELSEIVERRENDGAVTREEERV